MAALVSADAWRYAVMTVAELAGPDDVRADPDTGEPLAQP